MRKDRGSPTWGLILLAAFTLAVGPTPILGEVPEVDIPTMAEAIDLLQINEILALNNKVTEKEKERKVKEQETEKLKKKLNVKKKEIELVIQQQIAEKENVKKQLKGSNVLVKFMMKALHNIAELKKEREITLEKQNEMVEKATAYNRKCSQESSDNAKLMETSQETISLQTENIQTLQNIIISSEALNASYHELEAIKASENNCDLPSFVSTMSAVLSNQEQEIEDLKKFMENDKMIKEHLENIKTEIVKEETPENQIDFNWDILGNYQKVIEKQSKNIQQLSSIASYASEVTAAFRYLEDGSGNLVSASSCQCIPKFEDDNIISVVLESQGQKVFSTWTPWEYQNCFQREISDNVTVDCGLGSKRRTRVVNVDSDLWEEETETEGCSHPQEEECRLPNLKFYVPSSWTPCVDQKHRRWMLFPTQDGVQTVEETEDCVPHDVQCTRPYNTLSDSWRRIAHQSSHRPYSCDKRNGFKGNAWNRFVLEGKNGAIPTVKAPKRYMDSGKTCGTYTAAWMDATHPQLGEPPRSVQMKFERESGSNRDVTEAKVVACAEEDGKPFYLYYLPTPDECDLAYCATTNPVDPVDGVVIGSS